MRNRGFGALAMVLVGLGGCSQPPVPPDTFYRLEVPPPVPGQARIAGTLAVERFSTDALLAGRPIVHRAAEPPHELVEYHYHFWTQSPTLMLRDALVDYLRAAGAAPMVITPEHRVDADYQLTGTIKRLEKIDGRPPKVVLELELALRERTGTRLVLLKTYRVDVPAADDTVAAAVLALDTALGRMFGEVLADLGQP